MSANTWRITPIDPRSPEAGALIRALTDELNMRYGATVDASGGYKAEEAGGPGSTFLVGAIDGRAAACGALRPLLPGIAEIKRMYVVPDRRGLGGARAVLTALEERASRSGYLAIRLETGDRQPEAVALYERAGYRRIPNYWPLTHNERSFCFEKSLPRAASAAPRVRRIQARLHVGDLARSAAFYGECLGLTVASTWPEDRPTFAILHQGGVELQLVQTTSEGPVVATCTLWVDAEDVLAQHERLSPIAPIEWGPEVYHYGRREFAVRDPDGHLVIVSEGTADPPTCADD